MKYRWSQFSAELRAGSCILFAFSGYYFDGFQVQQALREQSSRSLQGKVRLSVWLGYAAASSIKTYPALNQLCFYVTPIDVT